MSSIASFFFVGPTDTHNWYSVAVYASIGWMYLGSLNRLCADVPCLRPFIAIENSLLTKHFSPCLLPLQSLLLLRYALSSIPYFLLFFSSRSRSDQRVWTRQAYAQAVSHCSMWPFLIDSLIMQGYTNGPFANRGLDTSLEAVTEV